MVSEAENLTPGFASCDEMTDREKDEREILPW